MCYKDEVQKKNADKLQQKLNKENIPLFVQLYLLNQKSQLGALNYLSVIKHLLQWFICKGVIKKDSISDIVPDDMKYIESAYINIYLNEMEQKGISPTTLYTKKNIIRSFWRYMVNSPNIPVEHNIVKDVAYDGISSNCNSRYAKMPTQKELDDMMDNIIKKNDQFIRDRNRLILIILENTGLRECELVELEFSSLFLEGSNFEPSPFIRVMGKGVYYMENGRNVLLCQTAKDAFLEWLKIRNTMNALDNKAVFINKTGRRIKESDVRNMFKVYSKGKLTPHMIRHWYGSEAEKIGGVAFAQQQLGHKSVNVTVNTYVDGGHGIREKLAQI